MAQFKVGQRVRVIGYVERPHVLGCEGVIVRRAVLFERNWIVHLPGVAHIGPASIEPEHYSIRPEHLAPLTDPHAEQFLEWVRMLDKAPMRESDEMETVRSGA